MSGQWDWRLKDLFVFNKKYSSHFGSSGRYPWDHLLLLTRGAVLAVRCSINQVTILPFQVTFDLNGQAATGRSVYITLCLFLSVNSFRGRIQSVEMITIKWCGISCWIFSYSLRNSGMNIQPSERRYQWVDIHAGQCRVQQQTKLIHSIYYLNLQLRPYSQTQSSWSMIRNFIKDDIFIVICILSWSNHPIEQIRALLSPVSTNSANKVK